MPFRLLLAFVWLFSVSPQQTAAPRDLVSELVLQLEKVVQAGDRAALSALLLDEKQAPDLVATVGTGSARRVVIKERDRTPLPDNSQRLLLEVFIESGVEGRLSTWSVDLAQSGQGWKIQRAVRLAFVGGLHRLSLNGAKQFDVRDLKVEATDLTLHLRRGSAFVAETSDGVTAVVLIGAGEMRFSPPDAAEKTQLRIFGGNEVLQTGFNAAFIRVRPSDFTRRFPAAALVPRDVSASDLRRATGVFDSYIGRTLQIDLADISRERWSITPQQGDFIAEVRTKGSGSLTYTRSGHDAEDVTLFDRYRRRNISIYASKEKLAERGRFYNEDDLVDYDILDYDIEGSFSPERQFLEGVARIKVKVKAPAISTLSLRLAETLAVRSVSSPDLGRLLHLRVTGQSTLLVSLPGFVSAGTELWVTVHYGGRIAPQELEREAITVSQDPDAVVIPPEPRLLYSHRAYWYPQSSVSDYATAKLSLTLPAGYEAVATGAPVGPPAPAPGVTEPGQRPRRLFSYATERPVRYLAFVVSSLRDVESRTVDDVELRFVANSRQVSRARANADRAEEIFRYYASLTGKAPYPSFTVTFTERELPGGHSPPYFAVVDHPILVGGISWRSDPVNFESYPSFFIAHEIAHQWWGQAVGWKNYHEQWLSEGFAQYFAVLYAERHLSRGTVSNVLRQMRQTAIAQSDQGPVYLGYRLGHIKGQTAVFRSVVYNKAAMVLHMLRRFIGDEAFFKSIKEFYTGWEYKKAGTDDFRVVAERISGRDLSRFFETWIYGQRVPVLKFAHRVDGSDVVLRFEQQGAPVDVAITVALTDSAGETRQVTVPVTEAVSETRVPIPGGLRSAVANADHAALVHIVR
jgi:hypothetical protein